MSTRLARFLPDQAPLPSPVRPRPVLRLIVAEDGISVQRSAIEYTHRETGLIHGGHADSLGIRLRN